MSGDLANSLDRLAPQSGVAWTWLLGAGPVLYLGLNGGGFDPLVHDPLGIAVWWVLLAAVAVGALPRRRPGAPAWAALALLAAFAAWTALSLLWTDSPDGSWDDVAYVSAYLGVFALAAFSRGAGRPAHLLAAVGTAIAVVAAVGLLSRLHPDWFSEANATARFLGERERLAYPLNYWNALAALIAIGMPLLLAAATEARSVALRGLAAASLPALALTAFFTLSRGGIAAALVALAVFLALSGNRLPKLAALLLAGGGSAVLILAADGREALREGLLNETARQQGDEMLLLTILVCAAVGLVLAAISFALGRGRRPAWTRPNRPASIGFLAAGLVALLLAAAALDASGRASDGWDEFTEGGGAGEGPARLTSAAGQNRYQYWSSARRENASQPLIGTGAGSFETWWLADRDSLSTVEDAHSLYLQVLGELGIVGLLLLAGFLLTVLGSGAIRALGASGAGRTYLAAALAGCVAFCLGAAYDWLWQVAVLPVATLLLASLLVFPAELPAGRRGAFAVPARLGLAAAALLAIAAIAMPLASASLLRQSQEDARDGDLAGALDAARSAADVLPGTSAPRLQEALLLESLGRLGPAAEAARAAAGSGTGSWRSWLTLSRIEAKRGRADAALRAYREARERNPRSTLFE